MRRSGGEQVVVSNEKEGGQIGVEKQSQVAQ